MISFEKILCLNLKRHYILLVGFIIFSSRSPAQVSSINLNPSTLDIQSTDLVNSTGDLLGVLEIQKMISKKIDISKLEPSPDQLWRPEGFLKQQNFENIGARQAEFIEIEASGEKEVIIKAKMDGEVFRFCLSRRFRNTLLRGALLEKLGYRVPWIRYAPAVEFKLSNPEKLQDILAELKLKVIDGEDWIISKDASRIVLRDVVVQEKFDNYLNLSDGTAAESLIQNERKYEALLLPWSMAEIEESMNTEPWKSVYVDNEKVYFLNDNGSNIRANLYDARWILRRIAKLSKQELREVVNKAYFPPGFEGLVTEQITARRNSQMKVFFSVSEPEYQDLPVDKDYSYSDYIQKGFVDYANYKKAEGSKFPKTVTQLVSSEMPLLFKDGDLWTIFKSLFKSNAVSGVISYFHQRANYDTNLGQNIAQQMDDKFWDDVEKYAETGKIGTEKSHLKPIPYRNGRIVYGSDLVIGNYAGTRNLFQRVDVMGFMASTGVLFDRTRFLNPFEYPDKLKYFFDVSAGVQVYLTRVKPLFVDEKKEIIVNPEGDSTIAALWSLALIPSGDTADPEKRLKEFLATFKTGESLILTMSVAGKESVNWQKPFNPLTSAYLKIWSDQQVLKRIHIHRINDNILQVYEDTASTLNVLPSGFEFGLNSLISIFSLSANRMNPNADTNLVLVDLRAPRGPKDLVSAMGHLFRSFDLKELRKLSLNLNVTHDLNQNTWDLNLLTQSWSWLNTSDSFKFILPNQVSKSVYYQSYTSRSAFNPLQFGVGVLNALWHKHHPDSALSLSKTGNISSTDSPLVPSQTREIRYEHVLDNHGGIDDQKLILKFSEKNPGIERDELMQKISTINQSYGDYFFDANQFIKTRKIRFFELDMQVTIHQAGILKLLTYGSAELLDLLKKKRFGTSLSMMDPNDDYFRSQQQALNYLVYRIESVKKKYRGINTEADAKEFAEPLTDFVTLLVDTLSLPEIISLVGGLENVFLTGQISGFRMGDENAFRKPVVIAQSQGRVDKYKNGPLAYYTQSLELANQQYILLPSEILAQWLVRK